MRSIDPVPAASFQLASGFTPGREPRRTERVVDELPRAGERLVGHQKRYFRLHGRVADVCALFEIEDVHHMPLCVADLTAIIKELPYQLLLSPA